MAAHVWLRTASSPTLDLDEAEQALLSQRLQWGYGTQGPLFTWLQTPLIRWFGAGVFPIALLKCTLLTGIFAAAHAAATRLVADERRQAAAASLFLLPYLAYQSLRDSSHSILVTLASALTLACILRLAERRDIAGYIWLGLSIAAGCLSKYNFALFLVPAAVACAAVAEFRPILFDRRIIASLAIAIIACAPHAAWLISNFDAATADSIEKLKMKGLSPLRSLAKLAECLFRFSAVALAAFAICFPKVFSIARPSSPSRAHVRWFEWFIGSGLVGLCAMMVATGATDLSERWLLPLLFCLPLALHARVGDYPKSAERRFAWCVGAAAVAVPIALAAHIQFGPTWRHPIRKSIDFSPVDRIAMAAPRPGTILAQNVFLAGNLKRLYPSARVHVPGLFSPGPVIREPIWVVWQSKSSGFRRSVEKIVGFPWDRLRPQVVDLPYFHPDGLRPTQIFIASAEVPWQ